MCSLSSGQCNPTLACGELHQRNAALLRIDVASQNQTRSSQRGRLNRLGLRHQALGKCRPAIMDWTDQMTSAALYCWGLERFDISQGVACMFEEAAAVGGGH